MEGTVEKHSIRPVQYTRLDLAKKKCKIDMLFGYKWSFNLCLFNVKPVFASFFFFFINMHLNEKQIQSTLMLSRSEDSFGILKQSF